jgi:hypothetical protein
MAKKVAMLNQKAPNHRGKSLIFATPPDFCTAVTENHTLSSLEDAGPDQTRKRIPVSGEMPRTLIEAVTSHRLENPDHPEIGP